MKRWNFDRVGRGRSYAQGVSVHARSEAEAIEKAKELNLQELTSYEQRIAQQERLVFRDNAPCPPGSCRICDQGLEAGHE